MKFAPFTCPVCRTPLSHNSKSVTCAKKHCFDISKEGYINFLTSPPSAKALYNSEMIAARERFLAAGFYEAFVQGLLSVFPAEGLDGKAVSLVDAGCGSGFYLRRLHDYLKGMNVKVTSIGLDISKHAVRLAARLGKEHHYAVNDILSAINLTDSSVDYVFSIFSPRTPAEFHRILKEEGRLVIMMAGEKHLQELREPLGLLSIEDGKLERTREYVADYFQGKDDLEIVETLTLGQEDLIDLLSMSPNYFHKEKQCWEVLRTQREWEVTINARVLVLVPKRVVA